MRSLPNHTLTLLISMAVFLPYFALNRNSQQLFIRHHENLFILVLMGAAALALPQTRRGLHHIGAVVRKTRHIPPWLFTAIIAGSFFLLARYFSGALFSHIPHVADSQALYIQAKIIASGHFTIPAHPLQDFFNIQWFGVRDHIVYPSYPPGHALLLALGMLIHLPWIINPLIGALFVVAVYFLGREVGNRTTGYIAMCLALASPWIVFVSSSYMSLTSALLEVTLFVLFYIRMLKNQRWQDAVLAGIAIGFLGINRPQCLIMLSLFYIPHVLWMSYSDPRKYIRLYLLVVAAALPFAIFLLYYNYITVGTPWVAGYEKIHKGLYNWPFNVLVRYWDNLGLFWALLPRTGLHIEQLNRDFFCWPVPSLILVLVLFLFAMERRYAFILAASFLSCCAAMPLMGPSFTGLFGARHLYEASGLIIVLSALALQRLPVVTQYLLPMVKTPAMVGLLSVSCVALVVAGLHGRTRHMAWLYGNHYWEGNADYYYDVVDNVKGNALAFVESTDEFRYVARDMPPDDRARIIFARNKQKHNIRLMDYYPDRHVYYVGRATSGFLAPYLTTGGCFTRAPRYAFVRVR